MLPSRNNGRNLGNLPCLREPILEFSRYNGGKQVRFKIEHTLIAICEVIAVGVARGIRRLNYFSKNDGPYGGGY